MSEEIKNNQIPEEIKDICRICEENIHCQNKGCAFRSLGNEYCDYVLNATKLYLDLQQKVEQLEKDKSYANWYAVKKEKEVEQLENIIKCIKEYADWHVGCCTDDINDYIDDDPKENKYIIDDLKEQREHWRDISKMCDGNFQLYMTNFIFAKE